jgi:hypothetical protein
VAFQGSAVRLFEQSHRRALYLCIRPARRLGNFKLPYNFSLSITASNITNAAANRYVGEPGFETGIERQHFVNGRNFGATLRYSFGG